MRQLVYALRFQGEARRVGPDGNILVTRTSATGCTFDSRVESEGLRGSMRPARGDAASFESELIFTGATTFQQTGTIVFGTGVHRLRFSTVGNAFLSPASNGEPRHGAAIWRVDGGEGQFAGACGLIATNFVLDEAGEVTDHQLGVLYVR